MMYDKEKAIENFRNMWEWMAKRTEELKRKVVKIEYFWEHNILEIPMCYCFLCEYANEQFINKGGEDYCEYCPIDFGYDICMGEEEAEGTMRIFDRWYYCPREDWEEAARLCREIAELPEKEKV